MEIKNVDRLLRRLDNVGNIDLKPIIGKATLIVEAQAKALTPVDTGALRSSIHPEVTKIGKEVVGRVYTSLEYAMYVEFGTGVRGNGSYPYEVNGLGYSSEHGGQVAQPYMYPALEMNKKKIQSLIDNEITELLKKSIKGG